METFNIHVYQFLQRQFHVRVSVFVLVLFFIHGWLRKMHVLLSWRANTRFWFNSLDFKSWSESFKFNVVRGGQKEKKHSKTSLKKSRGPPTILNGRFNVKDFVDFFCQRSKIETKHSFVLIIWRSHKQLLCFNRFLMYEAPINLFFWAAFKCFAYHNHVM